MKYHNTKIEVAGEKFDSKKEYERFVELQWLEKAGRISGLERQRKYELIPKQLGADGKVAERECSYVADFVYLEDGKIIVEDVKGYRDPSSAGYAKFVIKRKLMRYLYGIEVREV